jgi:hypothetical protein
VTKRSGRRARPGDPNAPAPEILAEKPGAGVTSPNAAETAWELVRIAYESHFELARHYSSLMFQARIAITTLIVVAVALGFGYLPNGKSSDIAFARVPARGLVTYVAALLINILYAMEVTYVVRFYRIVQSGRSIEQQYKAPAYFTGYERADSWPLYLAYLGGILVLIALFLGAGWVPNQGFARSAVLVLVSALPAVAFVRSYIGLIRTGRSLLEHL